MESQRTALKWTAMVSQVTGVTVLFIYLFDFVYLLNVNVLLLLQEILITSPLSKRGRKLQQQRSIDSIRRRIVYDCEGRIYFCDRNSTNRKGFMSFSTRFMSVIWHILFSRLLSLLFINLRLFIINIVCLSLKQCSGRACTPTAGGLGNIFYDFLTFSYTRLCKNLNVLEDKLALLQGFKHFPEV